MTIAGFLDANGVETDPNLATLADSQSRWSRVLTVKICVLVRSVDPIVTDAASARYYKCDGNIEQNPADLRLRRAYFSTVVMRNRMPPN
jgi:type IV pilus assembly protein PilW